MNQDPSELDGEDDIEWPISSALEAGLDIARNQLSERGIEGDFQRLMNETGELIVGDKLGFLRPSERREWTEVLEVLSDRNPWLRFAIELRLAEFGVGRIQEGLRRFRKIKPLYVYSPVSERTQLYLSEAVGCYLLGFDAACVAFCRATMEVVLKNRLKDLGHPAYELLREAPNLSTIVSDAATKGVLRSSTSKATRLKKRGDSTLHQSIPEARILEQSALDSIHDLREVLEEVLRAES